MRTEEKAMYVCEKCGNWTDIEEFVINFGWCDPCFDESYVLYIESVSGPFDWIAYNDK